MERSVERVERVEPRGRGRVCGWAAAVLVLVLGQAGAAGAQQACIQDTSPTDGRTLPAARCGLDFTIGVPQTCPEGGCGLIVDVHGFAMSAAIQERNTNLRRLGMEAGFVVAQPTANGGLLPSFSGAEDSVTIRAFMEEAIDRFDLNPSKIHIGGFSQGAGITFRFVCENSDLIASAAPIAGSGGGCFEDGPPVPVLQTQSTRDEFAQFGGFERTRAAILDGLGLDLDDGVVLASDDGITQMRFMNGRGQIYETIVHEFIGASAGAGHCFPGSFEMSLGGGGGGVSFLRFACDGSDQIRYGEAALQFYIDNPKR